MCVCVLGLACWLAWCVTHIPLRLAHSHALPFSRVSMLQHFTTHTSQTSIWSWSYMSILTYQRVIMCWPSAAMIAWHVERGTTRRENEMIKLCWMPFHRIHDQWLKLFCARVFVSSYTSAFCQCAWVRWAPRRAVGVSSTVVQLDVSVVARPLGDEWREEEEMREKNELVRLYLFGFKLFISLFWMWFEI